MASIRQADTTSCVRYATGDSARRSMQWCARRSDRHEKHAHKALLVLCARVCLLAPRRAATSLVVAALTLLIRAATFRVVVHHPGDRTSSSTGAQLAQVAAPTAACACARWHADDGPRHCACSMSHAITLGDGWGGGRRSRLAEHALCVLRHYWSVFQKNYLFPIWCGCL